MRKKLLCLGLIVSLIFFVILRSKADAETKYISKDGMHFEGEAGRVPHISYDEKRFECHDTLYLAEGGNVGIGTTDPDYLLHLSKTDEHSVLHIEADGASHGEANLFFKTQSDLGWQIFMDNSNLSVLGEADRLGFYHYGSSAARMVIDGSSGYIGIGTTDPKGVLHLSKSGVDYKALVFGDGDDDTFYIDAKFASTGQAGNWLEMHDLWGNNLMTWRNAKVGIGTTNPSSMLHISAEDGNVQLILEADTDNESGEEGEHPSILFSIDGGNNDAFIALEGIAGDTANGTLANSFIIGSTDNNPHLQFVTNNEVRMTFDLEGNIGIGVDDPSEVLDVVGNISLTGTVIPDNDCGIPGTAFTAEENAELNDNSYEWGFGNGATGPNIRSVQICSGVITGMSWRCNTAGTNTEVAIAISDGGDSGCNCSSSANQCTNTCNIPFSSNNGLNGYTINAGGASNCVLTFWVRYD
jgi:hypothetical protein